MKISTFVTTNAANFHKTTQLQIFRQTYFLVNLARKSLIDVTLFSFSFVGSGISGLSSASLALASSCEVMDLATAPGSLGNEGIEADLVPDLIIEAKLLTRFDNPTCRALVSAALILMFFCRDQTKG